MYQDNYVAINVSGGESSKSPSSKFSLLTLLRFWRRCTHLQKKLVIVVVTALFLFGIIQMTSNQSAVNVEAKHNQDKPVEKPVKNKRVEFVKEDLDFGIDVPHPLAQLSEEKQKNLNLLEKRVGEDINVLQSPKKRLPPKLIVRGEDVDIDEQAVRRKQGMKVSTTPPTTTTTVREPDPPPPFKVLGQGLELNENQKTVVKMFKHAWKSYKMHAWGHDHLHPISRTYDNWFHVGLTMIDSLDTMYIMRLEEEYLQARDYIARELTFDKNSDVNLFECTIRVLGAMLSAYHLSGDEIYKEKAIDIGNRLMPAMAKSRSAIPYSDVNLHTGVAHDPRWGPDSTISEVTSIQLEFRDLTFLTGEQTYKDAVDKISVHVAKTRGKKDGLVPIWINANTGLFRPGSTLTVGARADSYYEYLLKQWVQTGQKEQHLLDEYQNAIAAIQKHLVGYSKPNGFVYVGELLSGITPSPKMDHLVCFLPGTLALGASLFKHKDEEKAAEHMKLASELMKTCYEMYKSTPTGLSPEITYFNLNEGVDNDLIVKPLDRHNLLRPETVESLFYMWRITKDQKYRDWGSEILKAFEKYTKVNHGGYTSINNVLDPRNVQPKDKMESFFLGETLKYFFLLFSDDDKLIDLNEWVFNTEAHPLPIQHQ